MGQRAGVLVKIAIDGTKGSAMTWGKRVGTVLGLVRGADKGTGLGLGLGLKLGTHVGRRSWQKETRLRNMFWSVGCSGIGLRDHRSGQSRQSSTDNDGRWGRYKQGGFGLVTRRDSIRLS